MPRLVDDQLFGTDRKVVDPDLIDGGLRSKQFATVLDLLGYGEIDSILDVGGTGTDTFRKNVFLDGTPLQNANGDENFSDVEVFFKNGASDQTALQEINAIENTIPVGVQVTNATSITRSITDSNVDKVRISIQIPSLQKFEDNGDIKGTEVKISIRIVENNGIIHNPVEQNAINGKATSPFVKDFEIKFEKTMSFPVSITVIRDTADSTDSTLQNTTNWLSFTEINTDTSAYQGFAYVAIRFNAQEFQSYPKRMYRIKGTKIKVPSNTTIDSDNGRVIYPDDYVFDGTFKTDKEWCSDPAWILYDILTTDKGFGGTDGVIDADTLDVYSFYSASAYASTLITDPITNTTEPRFSCNVILNKKNDAYSLINDLCSVMNAMPFYSNGSLQISQDRPTNTATNTSDPQYIFNNSNITEEGFTYQGVGQRTKYTEVEVAYFDNDTQTIDYELITTDEITALSNSSTKFGKTRKTLKAFACTSRGQANRLGRWFLYSNLRESEVVSFTTTLEAGVIVRPSTIIAIADSLRAGVRRGGRIKSVTNTTTIVVDDANNTDLTTENSATLSVVLSDGSVESRSISSISGTTITVSSAFSSAPLANSVWAIENTSVEFQIYRVVSIEEKNDSEYTITAVIHDTNKYAQVEDTTVAANPRTITTLLNEKPSPSNLAATEQIVVLNNRAVSKIFVTWEPVQGVKEYLLEFQYENDNPERLRVARPSFELFESRLGTYTFAVKSVNTLGKLSSSTSNFTFVAQGKTALPVDPTDLTIEPVSEQFVRLRFTQSTDVDVLHGGNVIVRHTPTTGTNAIFTNAIDIIPALAGNISETLVPALTGTYLIKFKDDSGNLSENSAKIIVTQPDSQPHQIILTEREDTDSPPFQGTKVNTFYDATFDGLVLQGTSLLDDVADFDNITNFDFAGHDDITTGPISSTGSYEFQNVVDLGAKFNLILKRRLVTFGILPNSLFDSRTGNIDTWTDVDGETVESVNAKLLVATTDDDPSSGSASFTQFNVFANGEYSARGFKFKCEMTSNDPAQNINVSELGFEASVKRRTETVNTAIASGSSAKTVVFSHPFFTGTGSLGGSTTAFLPTIGITLEGAVTGDYFKITSVTGTQFVIEVRDASNNFKNLNFKYTAVGFGRGS
jgi:predicted phage tail protein